MTKRNSIFKLWLTMAIMAFAITVNGQAQPKKPTKTEYGYPERMVRSNLVKSKSTQIPPQKIDVPVTKTKSTKATCQYDNAGLASLSSSALVSYLKQTNDYNCHASILFNFDSYYSPKIFSNANIQAVLNAIYNASASFDGTTSAGLFGLVSYIHVAGYHEFFQPGAITLDQTSKNLYIQACDALSQNSHLLDLSASASDVCNEFIIILDYPGVRNRTRTFDFMKKVMRDLTIYDTWKQAADIKWITGRWNIFFLMFRGADDPIYMQALASDPTVMSLMYDVGIDAELRANSDLLFMADNGIGELARIATNALVKDQVCGYMANVAGMFPRLNKNWLKAVIALKDAGKCAQYNLCEDEPSLRLEVETMLFPNTFSYNDGKLVFRAKFGKETADMLYYATRQSESQFFRLGQTDEPVAGDVNNVLTAIVFEDVTKYEDYAPFLYNIATNNGGMYMEQPSEFYTWDRPATYSLSLEVLFRHEYVHYLQGRYWVPGFWGSGDIYANGKLVWFEEGSAELCSGGTDTEGIKLRSSNAWTATSESPTWPTVSDIINSNYNTPGFIYYPYGNLLWYYMYKNEPQRIKPLIDNVRANNSAAYDATMTSMKNDATLQTNFKNFLTQVANGTITSWDPTTDWTNDKYLSLSSITDIKNSFSSITGNTSATVSLDASNCIGRFKITGQITGQGTATNNSTAAIKVEEALNLMMNQLKADEWVNNFNSIVGYIENVSFTSNIPKADFTITGSLKNAEMPNILFANFEADQTTSLTGVDIKFTNTSLGSINSASWNFQGGAPSTSTNRDVTVKYNTAGQYNVSLTVSGQGTSDTRTKNSMINIYSKSALSYCTPTHTTPQVREIQGVIAGGVDNVSSFGLVNGYSDYTNLLVKFVKGQPNTIRVNATIMSTTYAANHLGVWIDYNSNGTFEVSEKVTEITGTEALYTQGYYLATINVPSTAISVPTKMRVRHAWINTGEVIDPCASYAEGEVEDYSIVFVGASDITAPTAPTLTKSNTTLNWSGASDNVGVTEYEVLYDNIIIGITSNTTYTVTGLTSGKEYPFAVKARDAAGNKSNPSNTVLLSTGIGTNYTLTVNVSGQGSVSPNSGTFTNGTTIQLTATPASGYQFSAWSGALTGSANPATLTMNANKVVTATFIQTSNISPTVSITFPANNTAFTVGSNVTINATAADTDGSVAKVEFYQGLTKLGEDATSPYSFTWNTVQLGSYSLTAKATDNLGAFTTSTAVSISVANTPPAYCAASTNGGPEGISKVAFGTINNSSTRDASGYHDYTTLSTNVSKGTSYNLAVTIIPYSDGSSNEVYAWFDWNIDGDFLDAGEYVLLTKPLTLGNATITVPAGAKSGTTRMRIRVAYDATSNVPCGTIDYGEVEDYNINISDGLTCTNPITAPGNLTSPSKTATSVSLSWSASTGGTSPCPALANYNVYRSGTLVGSPTSTSYTDSGLSPLTSYTYTVTAKDAAGSQTLASNTLNVTTLNVTSCTNPITAPSNLTSPSKTATSVSLSWSASTGGISPCPAFASYNVFRNGILVGSPTTNSFTDSGLSPLTSYAYTVKAKDAAGTLTAASNTLNVTTLANTGCTYCISKGNSYTYEWISNVQIGTFTNASAGSGYTDFTSKVISLTANSTFNVVLTPGFGGSSEIEYWKIWIDFNKNCSFSDPGEEVYSNYASTAVGGSLTIPATASGETTMRIAMKYYSAPTVCETFQYGEVEDYKVSFNAKASMTLTDVKTTENKTIDAEIFPNPASKQFTINLIGEKTANIQIMGVNGSIISQSNIDNSSITIDVSNMPSGLYYVKITTQNNSLVKKLIVN